MTVKMTEKGEIKEMTEQCKICDKILDKDSKYLDFGFCSTCGPEQHTGWVCTDCLCAFDGPLIGHKCPDCGTIKCHLLTDVWGVVHSKTENIIDEDFQKLRRWSVHIPFVCVGSISELQMNEQQ